MSTGLSAEVADALAVLGVDLGDVDTKGDLQRGLEDRRALGRRSLNSPSWGLRRQRA
jgi:hypothetical protein